MQHVLGHVAPAGSVLAVCAGEAEHEVMPEATLSDISSGEDAQALPHADSSFEWVFVSDGLHHCSQPHRALSEMYRVARRGVIVVESRDSVAVRVAARAGLTGDYEIESVTANGGIFGGVNNTAIPNHVYRWTEREFEKTLRSLDPTGPIRFRYFYALNLPARLAMFRFLERPASLLLPKQCNSFAMVAEKPELLWPWLDH